MEAEFYKLDPDKNLVFQSDSDSASFIIGIRIRIQILIFKSDIDQII